MGMFSPETEALRQRLAQQMTHSTGQSGGEWIQAKQRMNLLPPWYQTLSGESAGQGFTEALQAINQNRGDMQFGDTSINPIDFVNPVAGIFGGKLAKTADLMALREAMNRASAGDDAQKIWQETGWFKSPDGQWRFEIDDSASRFNSNAWQTRETDIFGHPVSYQAADAGDLMTHDDLYSAYPDLRPMAVGEYNGEHLGVYNAPTKMMPETMALQLGYGDNATRSVMLHEYQHAIQNREGFARGGSAESFKELPLNPAYARYMEARKTDPDLLEFSRLHNSHEYQQELAAQNRRWNEEFEPRYKELSAQLSTLGRRAPGSDKIREQLDELFAQAEAGSDQYPTMTRVDELSRRLKERGIPWQAPKETLSKNQAYQRLAGEAEARAVQSRMNLTPEQRRMRFPLDDYDVPVDELIMRYGDNGPNLATVWHGSPHRFDKFDLSKIGTGEGAQAYGHGLYFADSPGVAESYQKGLSIWEPKIDGKSVIELYAGGELPALIRQKTGITGGESHTAAKMLYNSVRQGRNFDEIYEEAVDESNRIARQLEFDNAEELSALARIKEQLAPIAPSPTTGAIYKVDLPDEQIANMLDWDAPLSEQPEAVRKALNNLLKAEGRGGGLERLSGDPTGAELYRMFGYGDYSTATQRLNKAGIPGIKYFDGGSRAAGEGTRNYVVFDDNLPKILERR